MATPSSWLKWQLIADDAMQFAPRPSVNEIVARAGMPRAQSAEAFLRQLKDEAALAEHRARLRVDESMTPDSNVFGLPVKTIEQGRSLGQRNLPGIENLSPEDQIALAQALDKGAMLRAMSGTGAPDQYNVRNWGGGHRTVRHRSGNRESAFTDAGTPFLGRSRELDMGSALALLQNKRDMRRLVGVDPNLPNPPALSFDIREGLVPSETAQALGGDVADLVRTIRRDRIDSRLMQQGDMQDAQLKDAMAQSADEVAAMEARAREYNRLPPETLSDMARAERSRQSLMSGNTERLTDDERFNWARQMGGNMDRVVGSPLYPKSQEHLIRDGETSAEYWWRQQGKDIIKGFGLGHILSYPLVYGAYKMMQPGDSPALPPYEPARHLGDIATEEDEAWLEADRAKTKAYMDSLPDVPIAFDKPDPTADLPQVPIELPEDPIAVMPRDEVGIPEVPLDDLTLSEESVQGAPAMDELDAELAAAGLRPAATNRQDITSMEVDGRRVDSLYPPESLEYKMEQAYKRRMARNPYPALSY